MKIALIITGVTLALMAIVFIYYGGLAKVNCRIDIQGGETLVFKDMTGDYARSGKLADEIYYALLNDYGIETFNPNYALENLLRIKIAANQVAS